MKKKLKKIIKSSIIIALLLCLMLLVGCSNNVIGTVSGAENEYIIIDNIKYIKDYSDDYQNYSSSDKDNFLGNVTAGDKIKMKVYSVKDDEEKNFIYTLWGYDGCFYVKEEIAEENSLDKLLQDIVTDDN